MHSLTTKTVPIVFISIRSLNASYGRRIFCFIENQTHSKEFKTKWKEDCMSKS